MKISKTIAAGLAALGLISAGAANAAPARVNTLVAPATTSLTAKRLHRLSAPVSTQSRGVNLELGIPAAVAFGVGVYLLADGGQSRSPGS